MKSSHELSRTNLPAWKSSGASTAISTLDFGTETCAAPSRDRPRGEQVAARLAACVFHSDRFWTRSTEWIVNALGSSVSMNAPSTRSYCRRAFY